MKSATLLCLLFSLVLCSLAQGQTVSTTYVGPQGNSADGTTYWNYTTNGGSTSPNWSPNPIVTSNDNPYPDSAYVGAIISGTNAPFINEPFAVGQLTLGGTLVFSTSLSGGLNIQPGNFSGSALTNTGTANFLSASGILTFTGNGDPTQSVIANSGTLTFTGSPGTSSPATIKIYQSPTQTVTLNGGGTLNLQDAHIDAGGVGTDGTLNNVDNTIEGYGEFGINNASGAGLDLANEGTVDANVAGQALLFNEISPALYGNEPVSTNTGTMEATDGGILILVTAEGNSGSGVLNNAGGTIAAQNGSTVSLQAEVDGGTLTQSGTGLLVSGGGFDGGAYDAQGITTLNGVTIQGTLTLDTAPNGGPGDGGAGTTYLEGTITNQGTINRISGQIYVNSSGATLSGGGTVVFSPNDPTDTNGENFNEISYYGSPPGTLTNQDNTIEGITTIYCPFVNEAGGTVDANNPYAISNAALDVDNAYFNDLPASNAGLFEATNGGRLIVTNLTNTGGTILADGANSIVLLEGAVTGGTLTTTNGGTIYPDGGATLTDGTNDGTIVIDPNTFSSYGAGLSLGGTITNNGTITVTNGGTLGISVPQGATLNGTGAIFLNDTNFSNYNYTASPITNNSTIEGYRGSNNGGSINDNLTNNGVVIPGQGTSTAGTLYIGGTYTQGSSGDLQVNITGSSQSGQLAVTNGAVNLSGTLTLHLGANFTPAQGLTYTVLTAPGGITGDFTNVVSDSPGLQIVSESVSSNQQSVTVTVNISATDPFGGTPYPSGGGWNYSPWFGTYNSEFYPWIYRTDIGFVYVDTADNINLYLYVLNGNPAPLGWLYTSEGDFPEVYSFTKGSWLYFFVGGTSFYNWSTGQFETY